LDLPGEGDKVLHEETIEKERSDVGEGYTFQCGHLTAPLEFI